MESLENDPREEMPLSLPTADSPVSGILKGGKLWRQQSTENTALKQLTEQLTVLPLLLFSFQFVLIIILFLLYIIVGTIPAIV